MSASTPQSRRVVALKDIERIRTIQQKWGAAIIADGLFGDMNVFMDAIAEVVKTDSRAAPAEKSLRTSHWFGVKTLALVREARQVLYSSIEFGRTLADRADREQRTVSQLVRILLRDVLQHA